MSKILRKRFLYPFLRLTQLVNDQGDLGWRVGTLVEGEERAEDGAICVVLPSKSPNLRIPESPIRALFVDMTRGLNDPLLSRIILFY